MKNRLQNYIKAIEYWKKYDPQSIGKLLQTAEKLKKLEVKSKGGIKVDRYNSYNKSLLNLVCLIKTLANYILYQNEYNQN